MVFFFSLGSLVLNLNPSIRIQRCNYFGPINKKTTVHANSMTRKEINCLISLDSI